MASIKLERGGVTATISLSDEETQAIVKEVGASALTGLLKGFLKSK